MRGLIFALLVGGTAAAGASDYPYLARVKAFRATIRSGPGRSFYVTDRCERGTQVEVHRREPSGWLAVRPLPESFSWVLADYLRPTEEPRVAEVVSSKAVSWVGTHLGQDRDHQWQVQLDLGEQVQVLGEQDVQLVSEASAKRCCKIAPPAGEFRWIHETEVERDEGGEPAEQIVDDGVTLANYRIRADSLATAGAPQEPVAAAVALEESAGGREPDGAVRPAAKFVDPRRSTESPRTASRETPWRAAKKTQRKSYENATLEDLHLELSLMVAQEPDGWDLSGLRTAAQRLVDLGATPLERAQAKRLVERIRDFERISTRRLQLTGSEPSSEDRSGTGTTEVVSRAADEAPAGEAKPDAIPPAESDARPAVDPQFDGTGWLVPVHSTRRVAPPFALLDNDGNVLQYVSPAPGLNLHRYLRKRVGIFGERSYQESLKASHVIAERVVDLERHRR